MYRRGDADRCRHRNAPTGIGRRDDCVSPSSQGDAEADEPRPSVAALVVEVAQGHGYSARIVAEKDQVELSGCGTSEWVLTLENLRRMVADAPGDHWPALIADHVGDVLSAMSLEGEAPLGTYELDRIRPLIRTRIYPEDMPNLGPPVVSRTLAPGLVQRVVLDHVNTIAPVTRDNLALWPIHEGDLFELAEANTRGDGLLEVADIDGPAGEEVVGLYGSPDYASAHIRWLGVYPTTGRWGSAFAVPCEGAIFVHPLNGTDSFVALWTLAKLATTLHAQRPSPVSSSVYWWHDGSIQFAAAIEESAEGLGLHVSPAFQEVMEDITHRADGTT